MCAKPTVLPSTHSPPAVTAWSSPPAAWQSEKDKRNLLRRELSLTWCNSIWKRNLKLPCSPTKLSTWTFPSYWVCPTPGDSTHAPLSILTPCIAISRLRNLRLAAPSPTSFSPSRWWWLQAVHALVTSPSLCLELGSVSGYSTSNS